MALYWGVRPLHLPEVQDEDELEHRMIEAALASGHVKRGERVVLTGGHPLGASAPTNFLKLMEV